MGPARAKGKTLTVHVEAGATRTFACVMDWPGWCRSGRDESSAIDALVASAPRYARVVAPARLGFRAPADRGAFRVAGRTPGNATTDFGAPGVPTPAERAPVDDAELKRLVALLRAGWRAFDDAVARATGRTLAKGPRGGGRELAAIVRHVREAEAGYLSGLGWRFTPGSGDERALLEETRRAVIEGLTASAHGEIPAKGPRGGVRWKPRFFVRRLGWHTLDHAWEIEDRASPGVTQD